MVGLSLAPVTFAAGPSTHKKGNNSGTVVKARGGQNSSNGALADQAEARPDLLIVQAPEVRPGPVTSRFPQGSKLIRVAPSALSPRNLTADFFAAADPPHLLRWPARAFRRQESRGLDLASLGNEH